MTRDYARTNVTIIQDQDFRDLPFPAALLYKTMWDHPDLTYCGVLDWRPGRIAAIHAGLTTEYVRTFAACLEARHFIVIDEDTEEALIRSWVRWDGLMRQPRMAVSFAKAYSSVASNKIRPVIVDELRKLAEREPDLSSWRDPRVQGVLSQPSVSVRDLPPITDPFGTGFEFTLGTGLGTTLGTGLGQTLPNVWVPPTPSPTPTPNYNKQIRSATADRVQRSADFDAWWDLYPKKVNKAAALRKWDSVVKAVEPEVLMAGLRAYVAEIAAKGIERQYVKGPDTWLNKGCWADDYSAPAPARPRTLFNPPRTPDDMPGHLYDAWNRAHADAHANGTRPPSDWRELQEAS